MTNSTRNLPISPAKTITSISISPCTPTQDEDDSHVQNKLESQSSNGPTSSAPVTPSPLVKNILNNLSTDISNIIRSKDNTIQHLFTQCEATRRDALKAENLHLQEKAHLLQTAGLDNAKGTARILELHLRIKELEKEKEGLASTFQSESFQLKKDIIDLKAWRTEAESIMDGLHKEKREVKAGFEEQLAEKDQLLEQAKLKADEDSKELEAEAKKVKELSGEVSELNQENNELLGEVRGLKTQLGGYKRAWEVFKESMDERLWIDEHRSKKASEIEH